MKEKEKIENTLMSRESSNLLQYSVVEEDIPGKKPSIGGLTPVPVFSPGSLNIQTLKDMFGNLSDKRIPSLISMPVLSLSANPSAESVINIEKSFDIPVIACVGLNQAWVQTARSILELMDRKGQVKKTVEIDFCINDMAMTTQGNILLPDRSNKCIMSMCKDGEIKKLFNTKWEPRGLCCLPNGEIVVAFKNDRKVVQYSSTGKIRKELDSSLFRFPWSVTYSHVNQQLVVCDKSMPYGLGASGIILAFHTNGKLQYYYAGSNTAIFTPEGVCADRVGHVLITDRNNHKIHILDKAGKLLQYLDEDHGCPFRWPETIDIDSEGYVWIGEYFTGKLKVVKYIQ